jgi:4-hydroxyphenylpyruvate dioxygenase
MSPAALDNPMGLMGFEFVEFASPQAGVLEPLFEAMGFRLVARHRSKDVVLFRQGGINFIVNREPKSLAGYFAFESRTRRIRGPWSWAHSRWMYPRAPWN